MGKKAKKTYTAAELVDRLRNKYSGQAYAVLEQVADGTGAGVGSWIDAAVFSLWPSNGYWRSACEIKVSRADWLKELAAPNKNEWARKHFDFFWYVTAPGVAKEEELPEGCGLMTVSGGGLAIVRHAPRREGVTTDPSLIASFARSLVRELDRFRYDLQRKLVQEDHGYILARAWQEAAEKFIRARKGHEYYTSADEIFRELERVSLDPECQVDRVEAEHMRRLLNDFQERLLEFFLKAAPLAVHSLNARDQVGEFICKRYGGQDVSLESLLRLAKVRKKRGYGSDFKTAAKVRQSLEELARQELATVEEGPHGEG